MAKPQSVALDLRNPLKLPALAEVNPALAKKIETQNRLQSQRLQFERARDGARQLIDAANKEAALALAEDEERASRGDRIGALLGLGEPEKPRASPMSIDKAMKVLTDANAMIADIDAALAVNAIALAEEEYRACLTINEVAEPHMRGLAAHICAKLIELHASTLAYGEALGQFREKKVRLVKIVPLMLHSLGDPASRYSGFSDYLFLCESEGIITRDQIPAQLKISEEDARR